MAQEYLEVLDQNELVEIDIDTSSVRSLYLIVDDGFGDSPVQHDFEVQSLRDKRTRREKYVTIERSIGVSNIVSKKFGADGTTLRVRIRNVTQSEAVFRLRVINED